MSVETLRRAAAVMRRDSSSEAESNDFLPAVADWLDATARDWQLINDGVMWSRAITWDATKHHAALVARAYLGEPGD